MKMEMSLGNLALLGGIAASIAAGIWQGGAIRATLESAIAAEKETRAVEIRQITGRLDDMRADMRELRAVVMNTTPPAPERKGRR
jgi:hypothetical protein